MVRSNICPACKAKAITSLSQLWEDDCIVCANCGERCDHSSLVFVLIALTILALYLWAVFSLSEPDLQSVVFVTLGMFTTWFAAIFFFVPLVAIKEKEPSLSPTEIKWYQSPVFWLGIPVIVLIIWSV